jgi:hypothetical protein
MAAALLVLTLLLGGAARLAGARRIEYFDLETRSLPLPNPPGLGPGPFGNAFFRETRDVTVLADGRSNARPIESWDLAVLRTFVLPGDRTHTFLALLSIADNRTFHLDMGIDQGDFIHSRLTSGGASCAYA